MQIFPRYRLLEKDISVIITKTDRHKNMPLFVIQITLIRLTTKIMVERHVEDNECVIKDAILDLVI